MNNNLLVLASVVAGVVNLAGTIPYVIDIFRGKTKPERAMWWVYTVLFSVLLLAQWGAEAGWLLLVTGEYIFSAALIAVLSLKYGYGKFHRRDTVSMGIAALGLLAWWLTSSPLIAILMVIVVDAAGFWLTLVKTWRAPHSETLIAWQLSFASATISVLSIDKWTFAVVSYPVYAALGAGFLVWLIMYRRTKVAEDPADF